MQIDNLGSGVKGTFLSISFLQFNLLIVVFQISTEGNIQEGAKLKSLLGFISLESRRPESLLMFEVKQLWAQFASLLLSFSGIDNTKLKAQMDRLILPGK